jgi:hypothetical protein
MRAATRQTAFSRIRWRASALWGLKWLAMAASVEDMKDCDKGFLVGDGGMLEVLGGGELESGLLHASTSWQWVLSSSREKMRSVEKSRDQNLWNFI